MSISNFHYFKYFKFKIFKILKDNFIGLNPEIQKFRNRHNIYIINSYINIMSISKF